MTSQHDKNETWAHKTKSTGSLMFFPCCDVLYAFITEQRTEKYNFFVLFNKYMKHIHSKRFTKLPCGIFCALKKMNCVR